MSSNLPGSETFVTSNFFKVNLEIGNGAELFKCPEEPGDGDVWLGNKQEQVIRAESTFCSGSARRANL